MARIVVPLLVVLTVLGAADRARACPAAPPQATRLELLTPTSTVLPADGALLVRRTSEPGADDQGGDRWQVRGADGAPIEPQVESLGDQLERWTVAGTGDLTIVDGAGATVATIHRGAARSRPPAAPRIRSITSTTLRQTLAPPQGILGAVVEVDLRGHPPAAARFLVIRSRGSSPRPYFAWTTTPDADGFGSATTTRKSCSGGGPPTTFIGDRLTARWIDALGRWSRPTQLVVRAAR